MNAEQYLKQNGTATVAELTALGVSRHKARHDLEALVTAGQAVKTTEGRSVKYSLLLPVEAIPGIVPQDVPEPVAAVAATLCSRRKALSVKVIARRLNLSLSEARTLVLAGLALGVLRRPYHRSQRVVAVG